MISFPFDNLSEEVLDRNISSDIFAMYLKRIVGTNGIFSELGAKMQVFAGTGMTILVQPGDGFIEGRLFVEDAPRELIVQSSESQDRIDRVVVRLDKALRTIDLYIKQGVPSVTPSAPALTRAGDIYELGIADIFVPKLSYSVSQARISDLRLNSSLCGIVPIFGSVDTSTLFVQIQAMIDDSKILYESFLEYYGIKTKELDELLKEFEDKGNLTLSAIQSWYDTIKNDINKRQSITFDDIAAMPGIEVVPDFNRPDNSILETAQMSFTKKKVAEYLTEFFDAEKRILETFIIYDDDGVNILTKIQYQTDTESLVTISQEVF